MKSVYWRPQKATPQVVLAIGCFAFVILVLVELLPTSRTEQRPEEKVKAMELADQGRLAIKQRREQLSLRINRAFDPRQTGLVGNAMSCLTSKPADLPAKQIALHPQFPAAVVQLLHDAGVKEGDVVAVGWSGSFPGMNVALAAAMEALNLQPIIVSSVMASQYGANEPEFVWLDMEQRLCEAGILSFRSRAATMGGPADRGLGMSEESVRLAREAMTRNNVPLLPSGRLLESIAARMDLYEREAGDRPIAAYINVGGGAASTGGIDGKSQFRPGLNVAAAAGAEPVDCVMRRFVDRGTPAIHLAETQRLARRFRLSNEDESWQIAASPLVVSRRPSRLGALAALLLIVCVLRGFVLTDLGYQLFRDLLNWARITKQPSLRVVGQPAGPQLMA